MPKRPQPTVEASQAPQGRDGPAHLLRRCPLRFTLREDGNELHLFHGLLHRSLCRRYDGDGLGGMPEAVHQEQRLFDRML